IKFGLEPGVGPAVAFQREHGEVHPGVRFILLECEKLAVGGDRGRPPGVIAGSEYFLCATAVPKLPKQVKFLWPSNSLINDSLSVWRPHRSVIWTFRCEPRECPAHQVIDPYICTRSLDCYRKPLTVRREV